MINTIPNNILRFVFLVLLQILILDNVSLTPLDVSPLLYVLFILLLPIETPKWLQLILALFLGLSIDTFEDSLGLNAAACVFMAFLRPFVLEMLSSREGYEVGTKPRLAHLGFKWHFKYTTLLILAHHFIYHYIEVFTFSNFFITLFTVVANALFTYILVLLSELLFYRRRR